MTSILIEKMIDVNDKARYVTYTKDVATVPQTQLEKTSQSKIIEVGMTLERLTCTMKKKLEL